MRRAVLAAFLIGLFLAGCGGNGSQPAGITGKVVLSRDHIRSGATIHGKIVFKNGTSKTRILVSGCRVDGLYGVALNASGPDLNNGPASFAVGCFHKDHLVARPGTTAYPFKVTATYLSCSQAAEDQPPRTSKNWMPLCLRDAKGERDIAPPLPAGRYAAVFYPNGKWNGPTVTSETVTVARP
jgi:hypothetical protein